MAKVVAGVEKLGLFRLKISDEELQDERTHQGNESGLECRRQPGRHVLQRLPDASHVTLGLQGLAEGPDSLAQSKNRANETHHRDGPDKALDEAVAGVDLLLVISSLSLKNARDVADLTDVLEVGECPLYSIEQQEMACRIS